MGNAIEVYQERPNPFFEFLITGAVTQAVLTLLAVGTLKIAVDTIVADAIVAELGSAIAFGSSKCGKALRIFLCILSVGLLAILIVAVAHRFNKHKQYLAYESIFAGEKLSTLPKSTATGKRLEPDGQEKVVVGVATQQGVDGGSLPPDVTTGTAGNSLPPDDAITGTAASSSESEESSPGNQITAEEPTEHKEEGGFSKGIAILKAGGGLGAALGAVFNRRQPTDEAATAIEAPVPVPVKIATQLQLVPGLNHDCDNCSKYYLSDSQSGDDAPRSSTGKQQQSANVAQQTTTATKPSRFADFKDACRNGVRKIGGLLRKNPKKKDEQNMAELIGDAQMDVSSGDDGQDNVNTGEGSSYYSASDEPTQPIADGAAESLVVAPQEKSRPSGFRAFFQCKSKPTEADVDARIAELNGRLRDLETELCSGLCVGTATSIDIQLYHITTVIRSELEGFAPDRVTGELLSKLEEFSSDPRDRKSIEAVDRALYLAKHPHTFFVRRTVGLMGLLRSCSGTSDNAIVEALLPKAIYVKQIDEALDRIRKQSSKEDIRYMRISRAKQALAALIDEALRITNGDHPKGKLGEFASSVTSVSQSLRNTMELLPEVTDANTANDFYERIFDICEDATDSFDEFGFRKIDFTEFKLAAE